MARASKASQDFVPIQDIRDNVLVMKDGRICMVLLASSINFALKSADEQRAILGQFQTFLNTLDFSIQIYVQSRRLNVEPYLAQLRQREPDQDNDLMRIQLREYIQFIKTFTTDVDVMTKNFFIIVPYNPGTISLGSNLGSILGKSTTRKKADDMKFEEQRLQLEQRASLIEQGLNRIGVRTISLENEALVELYYHIFNPGEVGHDAPEVHV